MHLETTKEERPGGGGEGERDEVLLWSEEDDGAGWRDGCESKQQRGARQEGLVVGGEFVET